MSDYKINAVKVGPVITGSVREERPMTREERRTRVLLWWVTIFVVGTASVLAALLLATLTTLYFLLFAPTQTDERTTR